MSDLNQEYQTIVDNLCVLQENLGLSNAQFASHLGTDPSQWSSWKNLKQEMGFTRCGLLLKSLGESFAIKTDLRSWMLPGFTKGFIPDRNRANA